MQVYNMLCKLVKYSQAERLSEIEYEERIKDVLKELGWRNEGDIVFQESISIGAANSIRPDAILYHNGNKSVVVDFKEPNLQLKGKQASQITSYMKILRLDFGILIGQSIQLFYDDPSDKKEEPILVLNTPFIEDNEEAYVLINLLKKENFSAEKLEAFCKEKLRQIEEDKKVNDIIKELEEEDEESILSELLKGYLTSKYTESIAHKIIDNIVISIKSSEKYGKEQEFIIQNISPNSIQKSERYSGPAMPLEFVPRDEKLFKELLLDRKYAIREFHYNDGRIEQQTWNASNFTETADLRGNIRSIPIARKGKWQKEGIVKLVCKIEGYTE